VEQITLHLSNCAAVTCCRVGAPSPLQVFASYGIPGRVVYNSSPPFFQDSSPPLVVGATTFSAVQQVAILWEAHSAYYFTIVSCQVSAAVC
jgi:hypothetical protein